MKDKILCFIPTKNRYFTTLPLTLQSVIFQSKKPDKIMIYDDNDRPIDIHKQTQYMYLIKQMEMFNIEYEVVIGNEKGRGQLRGEQYANTYGYKYVWRIDDDQIQSRDVLEKYWNLLTEDVGAVGGCILNPNQPPDPNDFYSSKIKDCLKADTIQWLDGNDILEVELLHSTFLYRAGIVDYCLDLIHPNHEPPEMEFRGENIFSHELYRKGYRLLVDKNAKLYHYPHKQWRNDITCTEDKKIIEEMEYHHNIFIGKLREWGFTVVRNLKNPLWYQSYPRDHYILEDINFDQYTKDELIQLIKKLYNEGDIEACVERCKQVINVCFDPFIYKVMGMCYYELGEYEKGLECLNKYIEYDSNWVVLNYKGLILLEKGEIEKSYNVFIESLEVDNTIPDTYHNIGLLYKEIGNIDKAKESFNKAIELDHGFEEARNMLKEIENPHIENNNKPIKIIYYKDGWILNKIGNILVDNIDEAEYVDPQNLELDNPKQINYFIHYGIMPAKTNGINCAWFTHPEEEGPQQGRFWEAAKQVDLAICNNQKYSEQLKLLGINAINILPGVDEQYTPKLILGFVGKFYNHNNDRKGQKLLKEISQIPFVEIKTTEGKYRYDQLPDFYRSCDYIIVTSKVEGGPMCLLEGLSCGKQVILPETIGLASQFKDGIISYKENNYEDLRNVLYKLYKNKKFLNSLVNNCTWNNFIERHKEIFYRYLRELN